MTDSRFKSYDLKSELLETIEHKGFTEPTSVQKKILELDSIEQDLIVRAKTGSGKTLAFLLPLFNERNTEKGSPKVLILSPTRELAMQINREAEWLGRKERLLTTSLVGGMDISQQIRDLRKGASIVTGTPGRTLDHLKRGTLKVDDIHTVILDEGDHMLDMGFREELEAILDTVPERKRTWLFSATMPSEIKALSKRYLQNPFYISLVEEGAQHSEIEHKIYTVPRRTRVEGLVNVLLWEDSSKGLIFCHTRAETMKVAEKLQSEGFRASSLHGDMSQRERNTALSALRSGRISLLVATNVAARGLDVPGVEHVFQFGLPDDLETFTHRSGRTGRAGSDGENIVVLNPSESRKFKSMLRGTKIKAEWLNVPDSNEITARNRTKYEEKFFKKENSISKDIQEWTASLLERNDPFTLVAGLLDLTEKNISKGYDLKADLERDMAQKDHHSSRRRNEQRDGQRDSQRGGRNTRRDKGTVVKFNITDKEEWNPGRVLRSICSSLGVNHKEVAEINIRKDHIYVGLMPEALEKLSRHNSKLNEWGLSPSESAPQARKKGATGHSEHNQRRDKAPRKKPRSKTRIHG